MTLQQIEGHKKAQSYRYDVMVKVNPNWLRQICNDFILNCDSHDIIDDPDVLGSLLTEECSPAKHFSFYISVEIGFWVGVGVWGVLLGTRSCF